MMIDMKKYIPSLFKATDAPTKKITVEYFGADYKVFICRGGACPRPDRTGGSDN